MAMARVTEAMAVVRGHVALAHRGAAAFVAKDKTHKLDTYI